MKGRKVWTLLLIPALLISSGLFSGCDNPNGAGRSTGARARQSWNDTKSFGRGVTEGWRNH